MADFLGPSDFFEGVIFARGLQLPEALAFALPASENQIQWIRESDGALTGRIWTGLNGPSRNIVIEALGLSAAEFPLARVRAKANDGGVCELILQAGNGGTGNGSISAGAFNRKILDENAKSDFVQGLSEQGLDLIRGDINAAGVKQHGVGFSSVRNAVGNYTITFDTAFSGPPSVVCTSLPSVVFTSAQLGGAPTAAQFTVICVNETANPPVATDVGFHFIAVGPL